MRYMLLIYDTEPTAAEMAGPPSADDQTMMASWSRYTDELQASGTMLAGDAFQPTFTATTVRPEAGAPSTESGAIGDSALKLGGFYLIDVADQDAAIAWAAKMPVSEQGAVEVRPVMEFDTP